MDKYVAQIIFFCRIWYIKQIAKETFKNLDVDFGEVLFDIRNDDLQIGINLLNKVRSWRVHREWR